MAIGKHMSGSDWNTQLTLLYNLYGKFCDLAEQLAGFAAPLSDQELADKTGFSLGDVSDLKGAVNVANSLGKLSKGDTDGTVLTQARQVSNLLSKLGGA